MIMEGDNMLVIKKGKSKMKVAKSAYNNFYKGEN